MFLATEPYYDEILYSKDGQQFKWTEVEQLRRFPCLQRIALSRRQDGFKLHLQMPFSTHTLELLLKYVKGEALPSEDWLPVERVLAELEHNKEPDLVKFREQLTKTLVDQIADGNCIGLWKMAKRLRSVHGDAILEFVFQRLANAVLRQTIDTHFYRLPMADIMMLLTSDKLKVRHEMETFRLIEAWVEAWPDQRRPLLPHLMAAVRRQGIPSWITELGGRQLTDWKLGEEKGRTTVAKVLMLGGWEVRPMSDMQLLDYVNETWHLLSIKMPYQAAYHGAIWLRGELYVFGGGDNQSLHYNQLYKLNKQLHWLQLSSMSERRCYISNSSTELDGKIYVMGGHSGSRQLRTRLKTAEVYDPEEDRWTPLPSMHHARSDAAAATLKGKIFICGGFTGREVISSAEFLDPTAGVWTEMQQLPAPRTGLCLLPYSDGDGGDCLLALGGFNGNERFATVWLHQAEDKEAAWKEMPAMLQPRSNFTISSLGDLLLVVGGYFNQPIGQAEVFDGCKWRSAPHLTAGRSALRCVAIPRDADDLFLAMVNNINS